jgi:hypothetical protein
VHIDGPPRVLVVRNIEGSNRDEMSKWLNPQNSDIEFIHVVANSIDYRWSNWRENRDVLQMGVHGLVKNPNYQFLDDKLAMGVGTGDFPPGSFSLMSESEFTALARANALLDKKVWGRVTYCTARRTYIRKMPTGYSGP